MLDYLDGFVDYIALHMYVGNQTDNYYDFLATPMIMDQRTQLVRGMIREYNKSDRPIKIAWDEYNVWYRAREDASMVGVHALEEL